MRDYYLFLDESGHHGLKTVGQEYPIFLLCGCIIGKKYYEGAFTQNINLLKEKYFASSDIILHSRDIRKWQRNFTLLGDPKIRSEFYKDLDAFIGEADFKVISAAILKGQLIEKYGPQASSPYDLSLTFILERSVFLTDTLNCEKLEAVVESRGTKEDALLHSQYQMILANGTQYVTAERFKRRFVDIDFKKKNENIVGTQLCDLIAYPLANHVLYPERDNLAFKVIESKMYRQFPDDDFLGYGLKIFP